MHIWVPFSNKLQYLTSFIKKNAGNRQARLGLYFFSALESIVIPVPTDPLLAACVYAAPRKWWQIALLTSIYSVIGGLVGWSIGLYFGDFISILITNNMLPFLSSEKFYNITDLFSKHGILIVLLGAFTPLPFKLVTITAGLFKLNFVLFLISAFLGRGIRFLLVAGLVKHHKKPKVMVILSCSIGIVITLSYVILEL